jgi:phosphoribosylanthranilate isomerase
MRPTPIPGPFLTQDRLPVNGEGGLKMKIKICCIASVEEAELAIANGAWAIGLVGKMPSGPGPIEDSLIAKIAEHVRGRVETFLLTSEQSARGIIEHAKRTRTTTIQIVDRITQGSYDDLRRALPDIKLVQVIHVEDETSIDEALEAAQRVDYLLLDSGRPNLKVKELGGTGRVHDWEISRKIRERSGVPVFLAGGLTPENVAEAVRIVEPFGVDICSGVRTDGKLDRGKVRRFVGGIFFSGFSCHAIKK